MVDPSTIAVLSPKLLHDAAKSITFYAMGVKLEVPAEFETLPSRVDTLEKQMKFVLGILGGEPYSGTGIDKVNAKAKVLEFIASKKKQRESRLSDFEIMRYTGLPIELIDEIIVELEHEGKLIERGD